jgi:tRNA-splicing ligase RtcB
LIRGKMEQREIYSQMLGEKAKFWTGDMEVEQEALEQIRRTSMLPILGGYVAVMPDVHAGKGSTVGTVLPTRSAILPACVGVDIGCGMIAVQTSLKASDLPESLTTLRHQIERDVPVGFNHHKKTLNFNGMGLEGMRIQRERDALLNRFSGLRIMDRIQRFDEKRMELQLGTLGGGNHFEEICIDTEQNVWIMLHSGSRNVGKTVGEAATELAKEEMARQHISLVDKELSWLAEGTPLFDEYIEAMLWCQAYAKLNRDIMMLLVINAMRRHLPDFTLVTRQSIATITSRSVRRTMASRFGSHEKVRWERLRVSGVSSHLQWVNRLSSYAVRGMRLHIVLVRMAPDGRCRGERQSVNSRWPILKRRPKV